jgi:hypothetical protein
MHRGTPLSSRVNKENKSVVFFLLTVKIINNINQKKFFWDE